MKRTEFPSPSHPTLHRPPRSRVAALALALLAAAAVAVPGPAAAQAPEPAVDPALLQALDYRLVGPYRGGRVTAVAGVVQEPDHFYMGSTGGGVWKTTDAGESWTNVSDGSVEAASIGAVAVAPSDPNVVWVGTGSACPRGNVSPGVGLYRSTDAGGSWQHAGLPEAGQIGAVRVHPDDPDRVWVAALGHAFGPNEERGVFRTTDGGESWEKVLFVSEEAGAVDLALSPGNPRVLLASIWPVVRRPWELVSGSEEGGVWRSADGGATWERLGEESGLPQGVVGRSAVAFSPADPDRAWALVEHEEGGLFRSEDGGRTFRLVNADRELRQRAWYYTHVDADPADADTVYVSNVAFHKSIDGGKSFETIDTPHGDNHALWIHPEDPLRMVQGNDGGANVSINGGETWSTQANQPTAELYRLTVDDGFPYRLYGAQQDNSTLSIPSRVRGVGIGRDDWWSVGGGESGHIAVDPRDRDIVYAGSYGGTITRYDHATGTERNVLAYPQLALGQAPRDLAYRFQWNAPIRISPHDPDTLYHCSNFVHRSTDAGQSWEVISPDLTRDDESKQGHSGGPITWDNTGVEVYGTIFAFEESPHEPGVLWAGTDDGRVWIRRGDDAEWEEITPGGMPEWAQVNDLVLSPHAAGRAFLAVTRYRLDDFAPYLFRTDDGGATWQLLTDGGNGIPAEHFVRAVAEDRERQGLLFAGTEFGLYVSFDDGARWQPLQLDLPVTPVTDLEVRDGDLVVATQGRSFWILDDLSPLRQLTDEVAAARLHLFAPRRAVRMDGVQADRPRLGQNPPAGAILHYVLGEELGEDDELTLEILDPAGEVVQTFSSTEEVDRAPDPWASFLGTTGGDTKLPAEKGLNRFVWNLRQPDAEMAEGVVVWGRGVGPKAVPGTYTARLALGEESREQSFEVIFDPALEVSAEDLEAQLDLALEIRDMMTRAHDGVERIRSVREQIDGAVERLEAGGAAEDAVAELRAAGDAADERLTALEEELTQPKSEARQDPLNFPPMLDNQILYLYGIVTGADARPTDGSVQRAAELEEQLAALEIELQAVIDGEVAAFNELAAEKGVAAVVVPEG